MHKLLILLSLCVILPGFSFAADPQEPYFDLAFSKAWLHMLHYEKRTFGGYKSRMPQGDFFISPEGSTSPLEELKADLVAFGENRLLGKLKIHPQCAFPFRFQWLKEKLNLAIQPVPCPKLEEYVKSFGTKPWTVQLVFSTAYPNSPGSMFGHTFVKFDSSQDSNLLNQAISYAANIEDDGGLLYMVRGVFGGYNGVFAKTPYYAKVNEYNNSESRDLWEYELNLTSQETHRLILHFWELETNSSFKYYFFDENCSFILLAALEAVKPDWPLSDHWLIVVPGETVKAVDRIPSAIRKVTFRPSLRKKFFQAFNGLKPDERAIIQRISTFDKGLALAEQSAEVLDVASLYFQYVKQRDGDQLDSRVLGLQKKILVARSRLRDSPGIGSRVLPELDTSNDPRFGHGSNRLSLSGGTGFQTSFVGLGFKFAYHDLMDSDFGYEHFSHFDFPYLNLRYYNQSQTVWVERINFVSLTSLFPWTLLEKRWSWKFALDYRSLKDISNQFSHAVHFDFGIGSTFQLSKHALLSSLIVPQIERSDSFGSGWRLIPQLEIMFLTELTSVLKLKLSSAPVLDLFQADRSPFYIQSGIGLNWAWSQNLAVQAEGQNWFRTDRNNNEIEIKILAYF